MKRLVFLTIAMLLILSACSSNQKITREGKVNLMTANEAYNRQDVDQALTYYELVLKDNPDNAVALRRVADINLYNGERFADRAVDLNKAAFEGYSKAIKVMEGFAKKNDKDLAAIRDMKKRRVSAWTRVYRAGEAQKEAGNTNDALRIFETAAAMDTSRIEPLVMLKTIYQQDLKDDAKAERIMLNIFDKNPNDPILLQEMGVFYFNKKDYTAAKPYFQKVYTQEPLNVNNLVNLSACNFELGDYAEAKRYNQMVLNLEPNKPEAITDAKFIAYKLKDNASAVGYLKQLLTLRDNDDDYREISFLLNEMQNYDDLITYAKKWYAYDNTNKDAVRLVILGAGMIKNKALADEYTAILTKMN